VLEREINGPERCACAGYMCYSLMVVTDHIHQILQSERSCGWGVAMFGQVPLLELYGVCTVFVIPLLIYTTVQKFGIT